MARARSQAVRIFHPEGGYRTIQRVSAEEAELLEKLGTVQPEFDPRDGVLLGFRMIGAELRRVDADVKSIQLAAMFDEGQMEMVVAHSGTRGLREIDRQELAKKGAAPEDAIERVQAKVRVWLRVTPARGSILEAWPLSGRELRDVHLHGR